MNKRELVAALPDWFHSIDLGDGVITPGRKTPAMLEAELASLRLPDLAGKSVLDVGTFDGFYTFAAERLGAARVVAVDHYVWAIGEGNAWDPDGLPGKRRFDLAHRTLGSRAEVIVADFPDADCDTLGGPFDVVLFLGVLYHMRAPLTALERVARATRGVAIIETEAMEITRGGERALCEFIEGAELNDDASNWWIPNEKALVGMCSAAGFSRVEVVRGAPRGAGGRMRQLAVARQARMNVSAIGRAAFRRLREELGGLRRYRAVVHAWK